ncbi:cytochrome c biogenesis CcdA family protein [Streptomyces cyaneofuscatus]|uniref:cytochrome c biogenesis CcdA family protein n=1 Tax=Streptomyces cyaneofuscatus TaxID=66883 RepID=UPI0033A7121B
MTIISALGLPQDILRYVGLALLVLIGLGLILPPVERLLEKPFARIPQRQVNKEGSAFALGLGLGLLYVPCAGPVLAAITIAGARGEISSDIVVLTLSFAVGTAVPLLVFALAGRRVAARVTAFRRRARGTADRRRVPDDRAGPGPGLRRHRGHPAGPARLHLRRPEEDRGQRRRAAAAVRSVRRLQQGAVPV